jgi:Formyl transferase
MISNSSSLASGLHEELGPFVLRAFEGRILNTHPALLPRFGGPGMYGDRVFEAVLEAGDAESGVSIHLVDADYDTLSLWRCKENRAVPTSAVAHRIINAMSDYFFCCSSGGVHRSASAIPAWTALWRRVMASALVKPAPMTTLQLPRPW